MGRDTCKFSHWTGTTKQPARPAPGQQVGKDIAGEAIGDLFGQSVSISDDGKMIAVGAPYNGEKNGMDCYSGHVRIYPLSDDGASWEQIGGDIYGDAAGDTSGSSVFLSANRSIVAIRAKMAGIDDMDRSSEGVLNR